MENTPTMQDHNLDDLIIDTPRSKESKAKGILTIIALLIVVLIVAIILTKIILKDPDTGTAALNDDATEMIDPELTLENTTQEPKAKEDNQAELSKMIESEIKDPEEEKVKTKTVTVEETPKAPQLVKPEPVKPAPAPVAKAPVKKEVVALPKDTYSTPKKAAPSKPKPAPVTVATGGYYIQVASYKNMLTTNSRLIKTLRKYHYSYKIMNENGMHKVRIGPYKSREAVDRAIVRVKNLINKSAFVVKK